MLEEIGYRAPCFAYGELPENPEWLSNLSQNLQLFWQKRRQVSVSTQQYFSWLYQAVWDCDVTMYESYQSDPDDRGVRLITTFLNLTKVGAVQTGRENKTAQYNSDGTTTLVADPSFNSEPSLYGQIPESWLMKQRHNPCVQSNSAAVYFDVRYRRTGQLIGTTGLNDPPITSWAGAPANASNISITSLVSDQTRYFYASFTVTFPLSRTLDVQPLAGFNLYVTHYDPDQNKIWPMLLFGGSPATVNWQGFAPRDADQPSTHPTTTALTVDGQNIPAGTSWNHQGSSGNLRISTRWFVKGKRDL